MLGRKKILITEESLIPTLFSPRNKDFHKIYIPSSMYSIVVGTTNDNLSFTSHSTAYTPLAKKIAQMCYL